MEDMYMAKQATITFENGEKIIIDLFEEAAPKTVENFETLAKKGFYDGVIFHRVIPGFVAQGGDPTGTGMGGPGYTIKCETEGNPHKHVAGSLSMAHAGKDTGGSQFFLVHEPQPHLDGVHTVFGQVTEGMDVVLRIKQGDVMETVVVEEV
jgi:peptidyl-prolyl cis-trans isomerase B (cyclophilin B)